MRWLLLVVLLGSAACGEDEPKDPLAGLDPKVRCNIEDGLWECRDEAMTDGCRCARKVDGGGLGCADSSECKLLCVYASGGCGTLEASGICQEFDTLHACYKELYLGADWPPPPAPPEGRLRECREKKCGRQ